MLYSVELLLTPYNVRFIAFLQIIFRQFPIVTPNFFRKLIFIALFITYFQPLNFALTIFHLKFSALLLIQKTPNFHNCLQILAS